MHRHDGVAAVNGLEVLRIIAGLGIDHAVPSVATAGGLVKFRGIGVMDGQVQDHEAVATEIGIELLRVVARLRVGLLVPGVAVAGSSAKLSRL